MTAAFRCLLSVEPRINFKSYLQTCLSLFKDITTRRLIADGRVLHGHLFKLGLSSEKYIAVKLLIMYLNFRNSCEINQMLKEFNGFNVIVHNCLISANVDWGNIDNARRVFDEMPERNEVSWTALISGLLKFGRVDEAMRYFERNPFHDVFSWTATINGFVHNGLKFEAMNLFQRMLQSGVTPNEVTFTSIVKACAEMGDIKLGMSILGLIVKLGFEHNLSVCNSLITFNLRLGQIDSARRIFYGMKERDVVSWTAILETGDLTEARKAFDQMPERNEVSWSAMIARYSHSGYAEEAINLFKKMIRDGFDPNTSCYSCIINSLSSLDAWQAGRNIHGNVIKIGFENDVFITSSLIDLYSKCSDTENGRLLFDSIKEKNVVCWNSMISGYGFNGQLQEAKEIFDLIPNKNSISWNTMITSFLENEEHENVIELFNDMILSSEKPNNSTFSTVLCACASLASLGLGQKLHVRIIKTGFEQDVFVATALTDMYAKSGNIDRSWKLFDSISDKNEITWTAMIQGLAENGYAEQSLSLFEKMENTSPFQPNELILSAVLFACSHCGLVDKGLGLFNSMETIYGVKPTNRHYTCVVDMLSRSGRLQEAECFIKNMELEPEMNAYASLLSGCRTYREEKMAEEAAEKMREAAEMKSGGYVLLSNVYALSGRWVDVMKTRKVMKEKGLKKSGGCSWVEIRNKIHQFYSQDGSHPVAAEIYGILDLLKVEMQ